MSEQTIARQSPPPAKALRRGLKIFGYGLGLTTAVFIAFAWWILLVWGAVALLLWVWSLLA